MAARLAKAMSSKANTRQAKPQGDQKAGQIAKAAKDAKVQAWESQAADFGWAQEDRPMSTIRSYWNN